MKILYENKEYEEGEADRLLHDLYMEAYEMNRNLYLNVDVKDYDPETDTVEIATWVSVGTNTWNTWTRDYNSPTITFWRIEAWSLGDIDGVSYDYDKDCWMSDGEPIEDPEDVADEQAWYWAWDNAKDFLADLKETVDAIKKWEGW